MKAIKNIFNSVLNYNTINSINKESGGPKLRKKGILLADALHYRIAYSQIDTTKDLVTSELNFINKTTYSRQGVKVSTLKKGIFLLLLIKLF